MISLKIMLEYHKRCIYQLIVSRLNFINDKLKDILVSRGDKFSLYSLYLKTKDAKDLLSIKNII